MEWGFDALTDGAFGLPADRIYATYFGGDEELGLPPDVEARDLWLRVLPEDRVLPGNRKDNFWEVGLKMVVPSPHCSFSFDNIFGRSWVDWRLFSLGVRAITVQYRCNLSCCNFDTGVGLTQNRGTISTRDSALYVSWHLTPGRNFP